MPLGCRSNFISPPKKLILPSLLSSHVSWAGVLPPPTGSPSPQGPQLKLSGWSQEAPLFQLEGKEAATRTKDSPHILSLSAFGLTQGPVVVLLTQFSQGMGCLYMYLSDLFLFSNFKIVS